MNSVRTQTLCPVSTEFSPMPQHNISWEYTFTRSSLGPRTWRMSTQLWGLKIKPMKKNPGSLILSLNKGEITVLRSKGDHFGQCNHVRLLRRCGIWGRLLTYWLAEWVTLLLWFYFLICDSRSARMLWRRSQVSSITTSVSSSSKNLSGVKSIWAVSSHKRKAI